MLIVAAAVMFSMAARGQDAAGPTIGFSYNFPGSEPEHYSLTVTSTGHAVYESNGKLTDQSEGDPFRLEFQMSDATRAKIFDLAGQLHQFEGQIDAGKNVAFTGTKKLSYKDGKKNTEATYNFSSIPAAQELTAVFQNTSMTLEFGRRLEFYHRYQKLALDDELKSMDQMSHDKNLAELPAVAPILRSIAKDTTLMRTARVRALRLLDKAGLLSTP